MDATASLATAIKDLWAATDLTVSVPGGLVYGRVKQGTARPYARLEIQMGETQRQTGISPYAQDYIITITVWGGANLTDASDIQTALLKLIPRYPQFENLTNNAVPLQCVSVPVPVTTDEDRYREQYTLIAQAAWVMTLEHSPYV